MHNKLKLIHILVIISLIALGIVSRIMSHPWNFTPLSAIALVLSTYFGWRWGVIAMLVIMLASDIFLGFYEWQMMLAVYLSFIFAVGLGTFIKRKKISTILFATLGSSLSFFFITNWAVWQFGTMYAPNFSGLIESYTMALPFFRHSLIGDLIYSTIFFGAFEFCLYFKAKISYTLLNSIKLGISTKNITEK